MDSGRLDDNSTVLDEFLNVCAGVGVANLSLLGRVEPDFALANTRNAGCKALL